MLKKLTLMALSTAALVAFAVPAVAQANLTWSEEGEIHGHGTLTSTSEAGFSTGPAPVAFSGVVSGSEGLITTFDIEGSEIPTNVPGCTVKGAAEVGEGWEVHLSTPDTMTITDLRFTLHYTGSSCPLPFLTAQGDMTFTVTSGNSASADEYDDSGSLSIVAPAALGGMDFTGDITWEGPWIE